MLSDPGATIVLALMMALGISAVAASIRILCRGKLYHRLNPETRPRRWVVISFVVLLAVFIVWFPVRMGWPYALISRVLAGLFGIAFVTVVLTFKWLSRVVDGYIQRRGWSITHCGREVVEKQTQLLGAGVASI